jgi:hypothetical protein
MTASSISTGAAIRRLLHEQRLKAKQLLLNVQQVELSVRFFMSAQEAAGGGTPAPAPNPDGTPASVDPMQL